MAVVSIAFPVLPGKEDAARAWAEECMGARREQWDELLAASRITRETWGLQQTPAGTLFLVWFESSDPEKAFEVVATGTDDFTVWHRGQLRDVTGIDLTQPQESPGPELILDWSK